MNKILWVILSISLLFLVVLLSAIWLLNTKTPGGADSVASAKLPVDDPQKGYTQPNPDQYIDYTIDNTTLPGLEKEKESAAKEFHTVQDLAMGEAVKDENEEKTSFIDPGTKIPQPETVKKAQPTAEKKYTPPRTTKKTTTTVTPQRKAYYIQTGAFSHKSNADENNTILSENGLGGRIVKGSKYYTVLIGPYATKAEAQKFLSWIKGIKGMESSYITYRP